jgi:hypothetical protein
MADAARLTGEKLNALRESIYIKNRRAVDLEAANSDSAEAKILRVRADAEAAELIQFSDAIDGEAADSSGSSIAALPAQSMGVGERKFDEEEAAPFEAAATPSSGGAQEISDASLSAAADALLRDPAFVKYFVSDYAFAEPSDIHAKRLQTALLGLLEAFDEQAVPQFNLNQRKEYHLYPNKPQQPPAAAQGSAKSAAAGAAEPKVAVAESALLSVGRSSLYEKGETAKFFLSQDVLHHLVAPLCVDGEWMHATLTARQVLKLAIDETERLWERMLDHDSVQDFFQPGGNRKGTQERPFALERWADWVKLARSIGYGGKKQRADGKYHHWVHICVGTLRLQIDAIHQYARPLDPRHYGFVEAVDAAVTTLIDSLDDHHQTPYIIIEEGANIGAAHYARIQQRNQIAHLSTVREGYVRELVINLLLRCSGNYVWGASFLGQVHSGVWQLAAIVRSNEQIKENNAHLFNEYSYSNLGHKLLSAFGDTPPSNSTLIQRARNMLSGQWHTDEQPGVFPWDEPLANVLLALFVSEVARCPSVLFSGHFLLDLIEAGLPRSAGDRRSECADVSNYAKLIADRASSEFESAAGKFNHYTFLGMFTEESRRLATHPMAHGTSFKDLKQEAAHGRPFMQIRSRRQEADLLLDWLGYQLAWRDARPSLRGQQLLPPGWLQVDRDRGGPSAVGVIGSDAAVPLPSLLPAWLPAPGSRQQRAEQLLAARITELLRQRLTSVDYMQVGELAGAPAAAAASVR